jgi:hypothetical protein
VHPERRFLGTPAAVLFLPKDVTAFPKEQALPKRRRDPIPLAHPHTLIRVVPERKRARGPRLQLAEYRGLYETSGNPLWLWSAYNFCRGMRLRVPRWVLHEFDEASNRLMYTRAPDEQPFFDDARPYRSWQHAVAAAFGFGVGHDGASDPFRARLRDADNLHLAVRVRVLVDGEGIGPTKAAASVAHQCGVDEKTVRNAWTTFERVALAGDLDEQRAVVARLDREMQQYQQDNGRPITLGRPITAGFRNQQKSRQRKQPT